MRSYVKGKYLVISLIVIVLSMLVVAPVMAYQTTPDNGTTDAPIDGSMVIDFDDPMRVGSVEVSVNPDPIYPIEKRWSNNDRTLTLTPTVSLLNDKSYTITVTGENETGETIDPIIFSFSTEVPPGIADTLSGFFGGLVESFLASLYGILIFLIILVIGFLIAKVAAKVICKVLDKSPLDEAMEKVGVHQQVNKIGVESVSILISKLFFWFIFAMFLQIALGYAGIDTLTAILTPVVLFIPRIIIAVVIIIVGLYVAEMVVAFLKKALDKTILGKELNNLDDKAKGTGFTVSSLIFISVKVFVLLIFLQVALAVLAISILSSFITPVLTLIPLILTAMVIVVIGLIVAEYVVKLLAGLLKEMDFDKLVDPVEAMVKRQGIIMRVLNGVVKMLVTLIFIQIAVGVLNSTGAFNMLAQLINSVILWIPNLLAAILIGLIGFWIASWVHEKVLEWGKDKDVPFLGTIATVMQFGVIYIAATMALDQAGIEVPMLYIVFSIAFGAIFIGIAVGFAFGSKDIFHNMISSLQSNQTLKIGQKVKVEEYEGTISDIGRYHLVLDTISGKVKLPHSKIAKAVIIEKV
ncbi:MAG: Ig-like domain-containing protein [Thermoplasmata archaeon]|nr:Ig-like domain-containing protein [Thermoplasmata archaeon]